MYLKFLLLLVLICLLCFSSQAQDRKIIVCDKPSDEKDYKRWLERDAAYIITNKEKEIFLKLETNEDREKFVENFWRRRDPNPNTEENEFREEYYERIAHANENFSSGIQGWKTDRGRIYIAYGKPDKIEKGRKDFDDLKNVLFETWHYKYPGANCSETEFTFEFTFTDPTESDEFRLLDEQREKFLKSAGKGLIICY